MIVQTEEKDLARDISSRALINTNVRALHEHRMKREQAIRIQKLEDDMAYVMTVLHEIRSALRDLGTGK